VTELVVRPLDATTWGLFAALAERHGGVWGGCWCMSFHPEGLPKGSTPEGNRAAKEARVRAGRAHAALVFDGDEAVGWCQFGSLEELPRMRHRRAAERGRDTPADWRITCFFVDRRRRRQGVAAAALLGALTLIADLGGGLVECVTEDTAGRTAQGSFLFTGTLGLFEEHGFQRVGQVGKHAWLVTRQVAAR
jgi:GNAT superfamily N-acetyltransferase